MRQLAFEQQHRNDWEQLRHVLDDLDRPKRKRQLTAVETGCLPKLYRAVCNHYALACSRHYSPALELELHEMIVRGHRHLYKGHGAHLWRLIIFISVGFPQAFRKHIAYFWVATFLLLVPGLLVGGYCYFDSELIYSVMDDTQVAQMEAMYDPSNRKPGRALDRSAETDMMMFGHYISNNIGIGFRTFAGGMLFGIGSVLLLLFNGVFIGAVAGHLTRMGYQETFWPFVSGHGSFELTAIVICGASGLMLGHALIAPGQRTCIDSLKWRAADALKLVMGAAVMLLVAAFIEAFWSSSDAAIALKYSVAAILWLFVALYLGFAGRGSRGAE
jgi:uncharacterized membrane protein SpoIIM required for sporulation